MIVLKVLMGVYGGKMACQLSCYKKQRWRHPAIRRGRPWLCDPSRSGEAMGQRAVCLMNIPGDELETGEFLLCARRAALHQAGKNTGRSGGRDRE